MSLIPGMTDEAVLITQDGDSGRSTFGARPDARAVRKRARPHDGRVTKGSWASSSSLGCRPRTSTTRGDGLHYRRILNGAGVPVSASICRLTKRSRIARFGVVRWCDGHDRRRGDVRKPASGDWHTVNQMVFGPDSYLYAGSGDGGWIDASFDSDGGQGVRNQLATILRIGPEQQAPATPFPWTTRSRMAPGRTPMKSGRTAHETMADQF
jgi:hypothetical protein